MAAGCRANGVVEAQQLADRLQVIPLSGTPQFEALFIDYLNFPLLAGELPPKE
jgi:hypothetical protein